MAGGPLENSSKGPLFDETGPLGIVSTFGENEKDGSYSKGKEIGKIKRNRFKQNSCILYANKVKVKLVCEGKLSKRRWLIQIFRFHPV